MIKILKIVAKQTDAALDAFLPRCQHQPEEIRRAMRYSLFAGGKRLRPALVIWSGELFGGRPRQMIPLAAALEMIHTYSLIHDDLPAIDNDDFRRGKLTCHKKFGEAIAILAGDALLTYAFQLLADTKIRGNNPTTPKTISRSNYHLDDIITEVASSAGSCGMIGGQVADLSGEGILPNSGTAKILLDYIHKHKTAALIRASIITGAVTAGATPRDVQRLGKYGECLGVAFQIQDDILDITGNKKKLGKRGSDRDNNKLTYPAVYGIEKSKCIAAKLARKAKRLLAPYGKKAWKLAALVDFAVKREY